MDTRSGETLDAPPKIEEDDAELAQTFGVSDSDASLVRSSKRPSVESLDRLQSSNADEVNLVRKKYTVLIGNAKTDPKHLSASQILNVMLGQLKTKSPSGVNDAKRILDVVRDVNPMAYSDIMKLVTENARVAPNAAENQLALALLSSHDGKTNDALEAYQTAVQLDPRYEGLYIVAPGPDNSSSLQAMKYHAASSKKSENDANLPTVVDDDASLLFDQNGIDPKRSSASQILNVMLDQLKTKSPSGVDDAKRILDVVRDVNPMAYSDIMKLVTENARVAPNAAENQLALALLSSHRDLVLSSMSVMLMKMRGAIGTHAHWSKDNVEQRKQEKTQKVKQIAKEDKDHHHGHIKDAHARAMDHWHRRDPKSKKSKESRWKAAKSALTLMSLGKSLRRKPIDVPAKAMPRLKRKDSHKQDHVRAAHARALGTFKRVSRGAKAKSKIKRKDSHTAHHVRNAHARAMDIFGKPKSPKRGPGARVKRPGLISIPSDAPPDAPPSLNKRESHQSHHCASDMSTKQDEESSGEGIKIFLRIRPSKKASDVWDMDPESGKFKFEVPVNKGLDLVNNTRSNYAFKFDGVLGMDASQEDVFESVAKDPVMSAIDGYNATIFAYGQTGSGKTYTITGGAEKYSDRGIIPRTLSLVYKEFERRSGETSFRAFVSFMEIYNGRGYDLLDPAHDANGAESMVPKVTMLEDESGNVHLRNLSMHPTRSEEEALNLLFLGDTNRAISETAMNTNSSRSHCIFTISIEARPVGSDTIRRSKLHLVDLAGSERVHKTGSRGKTLREANHINGSLHFLEMVIIALQERRKTGRGHIPYRNSMMTAMLRDSLGGNCKTSMIATMNPESTQTDESISTCRFAQRVARVKNTASVNEELDPALVIKRLKAEVKMLKEQILFLKGGVGSESGDTDVEESKSRSMTTTERSFMKKRIEAFVDDPDQSVRLTLGSGSDRSSSGMTFERIQTAFELFKVITRERSNGRSTRTMRESKIASDDNADDDDDDEKAMLRAQKRIERIRVEGALASKMDEELEPTDEERELIGQIEDEKRSYKSNFRRLKEMKREIEHTQKLIERSRKLLVREFEPWLENVRAESARKQQRDSSDRSTNDRSSKLVDSPTNRAVMTGAVGDDIKAFYAAKEELLSRFRETLGK
eukprot:g1171.t1